MQVRDCGDAASGAKPSTWGAKLERILFLPDTPDEQALTMIVHAVVACALIGLTVGFPH